MSFSKDDDKKDINEGKVISEPISFSPESINENNYKWYLRFLERFATNYHKFIKLNENGCANLIEKIEKLHEFLTSDTKYNGALIFFETSLKQLLAKASASFPSFGKEVTVFKQKKTFFREHVHNIQDSLQKNIELFCKNSLLIFLSKYQNKAKQNKALKVENIGKSYTTKSNPKISEFEKENSKELIENDTENRFLSREEILKKMNQFMIDYFIKSNFTKQDVMYVIKHGGVFKFFAETEHEVEFKTIYSKSFTKENKGYFDALMTCILALRVDEKFIFDDQVKIIKFFSGKGDISYVDMQAHLKFIKVINEFMRSSANSKLNIDKFFLIFSLAMPSLDEKNSVFELWKTFFSEITKKENLELIKQDNYQKIISFINDRKIMLSERCEFQALQEYFEQLKHNYLFGGIAESIKDKNWEQACTLIDGAAKAEQLIKPKLICKFDWRSTETVNVQEASALDRMVKDVIKRCGIYMELCKKVLDSKSIEDVLRIIEEFSGYNELYKKISEHDAFKKVKKHVLKVKAEHFNEKYILATGEFDKNVEVKAKHILCILSGDHDDLFAPFVAQRVELNNIAAIGQLINCMANLKHEWGFEELQQLFDFVFNKQFGTEKLPENLIRDILRVAIKYAELLFGVEMDERERMRLFAEHADVVAECKLDILNDFVDKVLEIENYPGEIAVEKGEDDVVIVHDDADDEILGVENYSSEIIAEKEEGNTIIIYGDIDSRSNKIFDKLDSLLRQSDKLHKIGFLVYALGDEKHQQRYELNCRICKIAKEMKSVENWPNIFEQNFSSEFNGADQEYKDILTKALNDGLANIEKLQDVNVVWLSNLGDLYKCFNVNVNEVCVKILAHLRHLTTEQQLKKGDNAAKIINCYRIILCISESNAQKNEVRERAVLLLSYFHLRFSFGVSGASDLPCVKNIETVMSVLGLQTTKFEKNISAFYKAYVLECFDQMFLDVDQEKKKFAEKHIVKLCNLSDLKANDVSFIEEQTDDFKLVVSLLKLKFSKIGELHALYFSNKDPNFADATSEKLIKIFEEDFLAQNIDIIIIRCTPFTNNGGGKEKFTQLYTDQVRLLANCVILDFQQEVMPFIKRHDWYQQMRSLIVGKCPDLVEKFDDALVGVFHVDKPNACGKDFLEKISVDKGYYSLLGLKHKFFFVFGYVIKDLEAVMSGGKYDDNFDEEKLEFIHNFPRLESNDNHKQKLKENYSLIKEGVVCLEKVMHEKSDDFFLEKLPSYIFCKLLLAMIDFARYRGDQKAEMFKLNSGSEFYTNLYIRLFHRVTKVVFQFAERCSKLLQHEKARKFYYMSRFHNVEFGYEHHDMKDKKYNETALIARSQHEYKIMLVYTWEEISAKTALFKAWEYKPVKIICPNCNGEVKVLDVQSQGQDDVCYNNLFNNMQSLTWSRDTLRNACLKYSIECGNLPIRMPELQADSTTPSSSYSAKHVKLHGVVVERQKAEEKLRKSNYHKQFNDKFSMSQIDFSGGKGQ